VHKQGLKQDSKKLGVRFQLADKDNRSQIILVDYKGVVPDTFKPGVEVIVEGRMLPSQGVFNANSLLTKCPSKYKKDAAS
jgi:cytochrome c-type biogenesis protein CcmE